ncbi:MAG: WS/DGAT domain-containing protein [Myxococcaceae bacterium]
MTSARLSAADKAWLRMDRPRSRMIITAVIVTSRRLARERVADLLAERLQAYPRFRCAPVLRANRRTPMEPFDIREHVLRAALSPAADERTLRAWLGSTLGRPLPMNRPLWELHVFERYGAEGSALVWRIHHALADGASLLRVLSSIADEAPSHAAGRRPRPRRTVVLHGMPLLFRSAVALVRLVLESGDARTRLKGPLSGARRVAWSEPIALDAVKDLARREHATVNDVLVAALAGAIRQYLEDHDEAPARPLRAIVPFDLRSKPADNALGNRFGLLFLSLPVDCPEPRERLRAVQRRMERLKRGPEAVIWFRLMELAGRLSPHISALGIRFFARKATVVLTNVAGPQEKLSVGGAPIRDIEFWVPHVGGLGIVFSIFSYAGAVRVGITSDAARVPDPETLARAFGHQMHELRTALATAPAAWTGFEPERPVSLPEPI